MGPGSCRAKTCFVGLWSLRLGWHVIPKHHPRPSGGGIVFHSIVYFFFKWCILYSISNHTMRKTYILLSLALFVAAGSMMFISGVQQAHAQLQCSGNTAPCYPMCSTFPTVTVPANASPVTVNCASNSCGATQAQCDYHTKTVGFTCNAGYTLSSNGQCVATSSSGGSSSASLNLLVDGKTSESVAVNQSYTLAWTSSGSVSNVSLYRGTTQVLSNQSASGSTSDSQSTSGTYTYYASANGGSVTSNSVTVTVNAAACTDSTWSPDPSTQCSGVSFTQTSNCGNTRTMTGTATCYACSGTTCSPVSSGTSGYLSSNCNNTCTTSSCTDSTWSPDPSTQCSGVSFTQTSNCGNTRTMTGTATCYACSGTTCSPVSSGTSGYLSSNCNNTCTTSSCTDSTWSPDPSTQCSGVSFTQTSNCGNTRQATGTGNCTYYYTCNTSQQCVTKTVTTPSAPASSCTTNSDCSSAINGSCSKATTQNGQTYLSTDTGWNSRPFCDVGIPSPSSPTFPSAGGSTSWTCSGTGGGTNASCSASRLSTSPSTSYNCNAKYQCVAVSGTRGTYPTQSSCQNACVAPPPASTPVSLLVNGSHNPPIIYVLAGQQSTNLSVQWSTGSHTPRNCSPGLTLNGTGFAQTILNKVLGWMGYHIGKSNGSTSVTATYDQTNPIYPLLFSITCQN